MNTIDEVKQILDILVKARVIDTILATMDHGFGEVSFKLTIQNKSIKVISLSETKTVKLDNIR